MLHVSTPPPPPPLPGNDAAADPSPARGAQGTLPVSSDLKLAAAEDPEDSPQSDFVLDSGATVNATGVEGLISDPRSPEDGSAGLRTRLGEVLRAVAVGGVNTRRFVIPDVYHVPELGRRRTLISVRQLARRGLAVSFGCDSCSIKEQSTGAVVGEGRLREEDGLYYLDYLRVPQS
ncbi:hypothetical protein ACP70R_007742 [Stipagrostis hirtigluma subsp. patula]